MKIFQCTRSSIDKGLHVARHEARLHLERPGAIRCIAPSPAPLVTPFTEKEDTQGLFAELQHMIFGAVEGECFGRTALEQRYAVDSELPSLTAGELSHLVSCRDCLDQVNTILELPLLKDRSPEYGLDRDNTSGPGDAGGSAITEMRKRSPKKDVPTRKLERRAREIFEHRPDRLQIAIDGEIRTSQKVAAETNDLHLKLARKEQPSFIEIFSEQGFCLAYLDVEDPALSDQLEQVETVTLSDNRSLILRVTFAAEAPIVHVVYRDPVVLEDASEDEYQAEARNRSAVGVLPLTVSSAAKQRPFARIAAWLSPLSSRIKQALLDMNPTLATAMVLAVASALCFFLWLRQPPIISANAFLVRAEVWDTAGDTSNKPGVVYQRISIRMPERTVNRVIYRDAQGIRRPKSRPLTAADAQLKDQLATADVNWDEPLSAASYQHWHDRQRVRKDAITQPEAHLLRLTTTVPEGPIREESLTVRDSDFHPVARTIKMQDAGTVEIAELSYDVLPWNAERESLFEPLAAAPRGAVGSPAAILPPHRPHYPSEMELDEAQLEAMVVLRQLGADTNERIDLVRGVNGVQVKGIVATAERKHEIETHLHQVPYVVSAIYTFQELQDRQSAANAITSIKQASSPTTPSPLEAYLIGRGMARAQIGELSIDLSNASVTVSQESMAIEELLTQFGKNKPLTPMARTAFDQLLADHKAKVLSSLNAEEQILAQAGISLPPMNGGQSGSQLEAATERHRALSSELLSDNGSQPRSAQAIAFELEQSLRQLRAIVASLSDPLPAPSMSLSSPPSN
jgi:hypothetical protein